MNAIDSKSQTEQLAEEIGKLLRKAILLALVSFMVLHLGTEAFHIFPEGTTIWNIFALVMIANYFRGSRS